jgi:hypothetical protein
MPNASPLVYAASRASVLARGAMWRGLREQGAQIVSSWIDEDGENETADFGNLWSRIENEIRAADRLVLYAEPDDFPLKGALIEAGMALAMGKPVYLILPGVTLDPRNFRPLGSWAAHPLVQRIEDLREAVFGQTEPAPNQVTRAAPRPGR